MKLDHWMTKNKIRDGVFAAQIGTSQATISRVRRGIHRPSWQLMDDIYEASGGKVKPNDFRNGQDE